MSKRITTNDLYQLFLEHEKKDMLMFEGIKTELKYIRKIGWTLVVIMAANTGINLPIGII